MTIDTEINPRPHIGQMSVDATLLAKRLSICAQGDTVFYGDLSAIIHRDIRGAARYILYTARKSCMRESKIVFGTVHGVGLRRLEGRVFVAAADQGRALLKPFARPLAERGVFAGERAGLEVGAAELELAADAGDEAVKLHAVSGIR